MHFTKALKRSFRGKSHSDSNGTQASEISSNLSNNPHLNDTPLVSGQTKLRETPTQQQKNVAQRALTAEEKQVLRKVQSQPVQMVPMSDFENDAEEAVDKAVSSRVTVTFHVYENTAVMVAAVPGHDVQKVREIEDLLTGFGDEKNSRPYLKASSKDAQEGRCSVVQEVKIKHFDLHTVKKNSKHRVYEARRKHCNGKVSQGKVLQFSVDVGDGADGENWALVRWLDARAGESGTTNSLDILRRRGTVH
eukprot:comp17677_c0_seq1/m.17493 comp17677_c0_seq1/g.17493  ORF comp17677_c0_seq1/g.17493 comp17677_c0_seq1/m.17493 type:complete len:249 (-) comp17677_c0_seq1:51-797(-)